MANKAFPDGWPNRYSCHQFREEIVNGNDYLEWSIVEPSGVEEDVYIEGTNVLLMAANAETERVTHSGISLGRNKYGQTMVLSKLGPNRPVEVTTGRYLNRYFRYVPTGEGKTRYSSFYNRQQRSAGKQMLF